MYEGKRFFFLSFNLDYIDAHASRNKKKISKKQCIMSKWTIYSIDDIVMLSMIIHNAIYIHILDR